MPSAITVERILTAWASLFGCAPAELRSAGTVVVPNRAFRAYGHGFLLAYRQCSLIAVPDDLVPAFQRASAGLPGEAILSVDFLLGVLGGRLDGWYGPAGVSCLDEGDFRPHDTRGARFLDPADADAYRDLRQAIEADEWTEAGQPELAQAPLIGCFAGRRLASIATWQPWGEELADVDVATHPADRGKGYAKAVVSALSRLGLERGLLMQYRVREGNLASAAVGRALGYRALARQMAFALRA